MESLREKIGVEMPWGEAPVAGVTDRPEVVGVGRSPFGLLAPHLHRGEAGAPGGPDGSVRFRFTAGLRAVDEDAGGTGRRLVSEPVVEAALDTRRPGGPAAEALADLLRVDDPEVLAALGDPERVAPSERSARAAVLAVAARSRVCAWEVRELRPASSLTVVLEHGVHLEHGPGTPPGFVLWGARQLRVGLGGLLADDELGIVDPAPEGEWIVVDGDILRAPDTVPRAVTPAAPNGGPRERARRHVLCQRWPEADERIRHLATTLDTAERVTAARLKTLVRLIGSARPDPLASLLFAEGIVPMHHVIDVLAPDCTRRDARLREVIRAAEIRIEALESDEAFRLTRLLAEAVDRVAS